MQNEHNLQFGVLINHEQKSFFSPIQQVIDALESILDVTPVDEIFAGFWAEMSR